MGRDLVLFLYPPSALALDFADAAALSPHPPLSNDMTSTQVLTHRRTLPSKINVPEVAERQAATLVGYIKKYTISQEVLRTNPTKMAELLATHQASTHPNIMKGTNPHHSRIQDVDRLLEDYNKALCQEPATFEECVPPLHIYPSI